MFAEKFIILTLFFCHVKRYKFLMFFVWEQFYTSCHMETHIHILTISQFFFSVDGHHVLLSGEYGQQKCFLKMGFFVLFLCLALEYFGVVRFSSVCPTSGFKNIPLASPHTHTLYTYMPHTQSQEAHTLSLVTFLIPFHFLLVVLRPH